MTTLNFLKSTGRAAIVAVALGAAAVTAMPAQAAGPQGNFSLQLNGSQPYGMQQYGQNGGSITLHFGNGNGYKNYCLTNNQVERQLEKRGFRQVDVVRKLKGDKVLVLARYGKVWYEMRVDKCSGRVDKVKPVYFFKGSKSHFNFTITF